MKTTVKQLAAGTLAALLLLAGNVNAEGTETKALNREVETTLQLEKWMTDEILWNSNLVTVSEFNQETETTLELENWMTSEKSWNVNFKAVEETEQKMEVEPWMTCDTIWNTTAIPVKTETEITVENGMVKDNIWDK